jgi:MazG family protein
MPRRLLCVSAVKRLFWTRMKPQKKKAPVSILNAVPDTLSPLSRAYRLTERAARVGFDWPHIEGVLQKLDEELAEFREALSLNDRERLREELGDLFFVLTNIARFLHIDPEDALNRTIRKFIARFRYIETSLQTEGRTISESSLEEMDRLWEKAKERKKRRVK